MNYEKQLHEDIDKIPKEKLQGYIMSYKNKVSSLFSSLSRYANSMVTGRSNFNFHKNEKANNAYQNKYEEFHTWRTRYLDAMQRMAESARPEEKNWKKYGRDSNAT